MCLSPSSAEAKTSAMAAQRDARRKGYCLDIIGQKCRLGKGIQPWQELHLGNQFPAQAKPLIQIVLPEWGDWRQTRFVFSSDKAPDCGRSGSLSPGPRQSLSWRQLQGNALGRGKSW